MHVYVYTEVSQDLAVVRTLYDPMDCSHTYKHMYVYMRVCVCACSAVSPRILEWVYIS